MYCENRQLRKEMKLLIDYMHYADKTNGNKYAIATMFHNSYIIGAKRASDIVFKISLYV